ncbi:MAG TPA: hypothetical protein DHU81_10905, partial [Hyphomonas sp.]|nr:hypothetical protein [Hyphomonas sp.]
MAGNWDFDLAILVIREPESRPTLNQTTFEGSGPDRPEARLNLANHPLIPFTRNYLETGCQEYAQSDAPALTRQQGDP